MDWIWSSRCLELSCTSTQSNNLKWVSGGCINSPRQPKSRWLTTTEKVSFGWTDAIFFKASVHLMPLPRHLAVEILWHNCSDAMHWRTVGSSGAEDPAAKSSLLVSSQPSDRQMLPLIMASVHPVLKALSWRVSVLIQTERQIDRRCPHSDRRIIRCYCLRCSSSATCPTLLENEPSVYPTVPLFSPSVPTRSTIAPTLAI
jgi:hypothetical protein